MLYPKENFVVENGMIECKLCRIKVVSWSTASSHNCLRGKQLLDKNPQPTARPKPEVAKPVEPVKKLVSDLGQFA